MVSPALAISARDERGGQMATLSDALALLAPDSAAVLTCGAFSMALFNGASELFDSPTHDNCAVHIRFASRDDTLAYLLQRFPMLAMVFALCVVQKRAHYPPRVFPQLEQAFRVADVLPPGFFYVFARDTCHKTKNKEYVLAGLDDCAVFSQLRSLNAHSSL